MEMAAIYWCNSRSDTPYIATNTRHLPENRMVTARQFTPNAEVYCNGVWGALTEN